MNRKHAAKEISGKSIFVFATKNGKVWKLRLPYCWDEGRRGREGMQWHLCTWRSCSKWWSTWSTWPWTSWRTSAYTSCNSILDIRYLFLYWSNDWLIDWLMIYVKSLVSTDTASWPRASSSVSLPWRLVATAAVAASSACWHRPDTTNKRTHETIDDQRTFAIYSLVGFTNVSISFFLSFLLLRWRNDWPEPAVSARLFIQWRRFNCQKKNTTNSLNEADSTVNKVQRHNAPLYCKRRRKSSALALSLSFVVVVVVVVVVAAAVVVVVGFFFFFFLAVPPPKSLIKNDPKNDLKPLAGGLGAQESSTLRKGLLAVQSPRLWRSLSESESESVCVFRVADGGRRVLHSHRPPSSPPESR